MNSAPETNADAWRETALTVSLLRPPGAEARTARLAKALLACEAGPTESGLPDAVAEHLAIPPGERAGCIAAARRAAGEFLAAGARRGLGLVAWREPDYPPLLSHLPDPPLVLWTRGDVRMLAKPAIAVVGSRAATPAALTIARILARDLAAAGMVIVSGMARGVDAAAHWGALDAGGTTVAVLGSGADRVYPPEHGALAERIAAAGALVSELGPGTPPRPRHFPLRNRIISGLARAVVVVEASERSGSLITARMAAEQGRDVLAVPGNVLSGRSRGCHRLIRDGARIVETAEDVLEEVFGPSALARPDSTRIKSLQLNELEETMAVGEPYSVDELAAETGKPTAALLAALGDLEVAGRIVRAPGGRYIRPGLD